MSEETESEETYASDGVHLTAEGFREIDELFSRMDCPICRDKIAGSAPTLAVAEPCRLCDGKSFVDDPVRVQAIRVAQKTPGVQPADLVGAVLGAEMVMKECLSVSIPELDYEALMKSVWRAIDEERRRVGPDRFDVADATAATRSVIWPWFTGCVKALHRAMVNHASASDTAHQLAVELGRMRDAERRRAP